MLRRHMGLLFTLIVLGCSVQTLLAQETRGRGETDRLVKGLRSMESRLTSLWMKGTWTTEVYDRNTQAMGEPLVDHFVAAFEGAPGGRTYLARNTIPARPEGVPTSNWRPRYETRFNGRVGLFLSENSGRGEEESPRGSITAGVHHELRDWGWTATMWKLSVFGASALDSQRYSETIAAAAERERFPLEVASGTFDGISTVIARVDDGSSRRTIHHDPDRGYSIVGMQLEKMGELRVVYRVIELRDCGNGIYYPVRAERESWTSGGIPSEKGRLVVSDLRVNNSESVSGLFALRVPFGVSVTDEVAEITVGSGRDPRSLEKALSSEVSRIRSATTPTADPTVVVLEAPPEHRAESTDPRGETVPSRRRAIGLVVMTASLVLGLVMLARRIGPRRAGLGGALLAVWVLAGSASAQDAPPGLAELDDFRAHSCGLNACGLILGLYDFSFDADRTASALDIGKTWDRPASLLSIVRVLAKAGLSAQSMKADDFSAMLPELDVGTVLLIHMKGGVFSAGHYFVFVRVSGDKILVADPGHGMAWVSTERMRLQYQPFMSGHFVVVSRFARVDPVPEIHDISASEVTLRPIAALHEKGELEIPITLENRGQYDLRFANAFGSCACFAGTKPEDVDGLIRAGGKGTLRILYDKSKLQLGRNKQQVRILFEGQKKREITVHILLNVSEAPPEDKVACIPERLDFRGTDGSPQILSLLIPATASILDTASSDSGVSIAPIDTRVAEWERETGPRRVHRFRVTMSPNALVGQARWVELRLEGTSVGNLRIPVVASDN